MPVINYAKPCADLVQSYGSLVQSYGSRIQIVGLLIQSLGSLIQIVGLPIQNLGSGNPSVWIPACQNAKRFWIGVPLSDPHISRERQTRSGYAVAGQRRDTEKGWTGSGVCTDSYSGTRCPVHAGHVPDTGKVAVIGRVCVGETMWLEWWDC